MKTQIRKAKTEIARATIRQRRNKHKLASSVSISASNYNKLILSANSLFCICLKVYLLCMLCCLRTKEMDTRFAYQDIIGSKFGTISNSPELCKRLS
jgi:hypothetical protein